MRRDNPHNPSINYLKKNVKLRENACGKKIQNSIKMVYLSFNKATAILGVVYAAVLFYYYRKLKLVWKREAERAQYGTVLFAALFLFSVASFGYVYYILKKKRALERKAADVISRHVNKPIYAKRSALSGTAAKIGSSILMAFIGFHRIMRKT